MTPSSRCQSPRRETQDMSHPLHVVWWPSIWACYNLAPMTFCIIIAVACHGISRAIEFANTVVTWPVPCFIVATMLVVVREVRAARMLLVLNRWPGECASCGHSRHGLDGSVPCPECGCPQLIVEPMCHAQTANMAPYSFVGLGESLFPRDGFVRLFGAVLGPILLAAAVLRLISSLVRVHGMPW